MKLPLINPQFMFACQVGVQHMGLGEHRTP